MLPLEKSLPWDGCWGRTQRQPRFDLPGVRLDLCPEPIQRQSRRVHRDGDDHTAHRDQGRRRSINDPQADHAADDQPGAQQDGAHCHVQKPGISLVR